MRRGIYSNQKMQYKFVLNYIPSHIYSRWSQNKTDRASVAI